MKIIEIQALSNGAHRNMEYENEAYSEELTVPEGWAIIPEDIEIPSSFPFVDITVRKGQVKSMVAIEVPEPTVEPEPVTELERIESQVYYTAMMTDTLIEEV